MAGVEGVSTVDVCATLGVRPKAFLKQVVNICKRYGIEVSTAGRAMTRSC